MRRAGDAGWPPWLNGGAVLVIGAALITLYGALLVASTLWRASGPMLVDMLAFLAAAWWLLPWSAARRARETRQGAAGPGQQDMKGTKPLPSAAVG